MQTALDSSDTAIRVVGIGKEFQIAGRESYRTLRDRLAAMFERSEKRTRDRFWALRDVNLEVKEGEVFGLIGRNGAGKSTLLKILARITEPTEGMATIHGRVGSLLEVGTGFHQELSGRENTYLSGAILGMPKREIERQFDEIVAFAEVERFIDTPVKHYSSGMYLRLAFAVAAHLQPEILLVDEVLAVGDAGFQAKCMGKMGEVARSGRTVVFVSHNLQAVQRLCTRCCVLHDGTVLMTGEPSEAIGAYLATGSSHPTEAIPETVFDDKLRLISITVLQDERPYADGVDFSRPFDLIIRYELLQALTSLLLGFDVIARDGSMLFRTYDLEAIGLGTRGAGIYESRLSIPAKILQPGSYRFDLLAAVHRQYWLSRGRVAFEITVRGMHQYDVTYPGLLLPIGSWRVDAKRATDEDARERNSVS